MINSNSFLIFNLIIKSPASHKETRTTHSQVYSKSVIAANVY